MSATIFAFPRSVPRQVLCRATDGSAPFTPAWCHSHLPLMNATMELLAVDDDDIARRCALIMADEEGG